MFKKKKNQNNIIVEVEIQTTFNDDESIYEDAENIEEVETDEDKNNETEQ